MQVFNNGRTEHLAKRDEAHQPHLFEGFMVSKRPGEEIPCGRPTATKRGVRDKRRLPPSPVKPGRSPFGTQLVGRAPESKSSIDESTNSDGDKNAFRLQT